MGHGAFPISLADTRADPAVAPVVERRADQGFITALESVRGIAAVVVLLSHACSVLAGENWALLLRTVWSLDTGEEVFRRVLLALLNGNAAVSLFFVLSGFVLALSLRRDDRPFGVKAGAFTARRFLRIYPALAVNLVMTVVLLWALSGAFPMVGFWRPDAHALGANLLLLDFKINGPTWTMLVELLAIPQLLVCHAVATRTGRRGLLLLALASFVGMLGAYLIVGLFPSHSPFWTVVYSYMLDGQLMFTLGFLVAEWQMRRRVDPGARRAAILLIAATVLLLGARAVFGFSSRAAILTEGLASVTIVAILAAAPRFAAHDILEWPPIRFLGRISYSLYLYHATVLVIVMPAITWLLTSAWTQPRPFATAGIISAIALLMTVPLGWASYAAVERPSMRLGRGL